MKIRRRAIAGFTIMEILIAIGTISVAILGTIAAIAFGLRASKLGSENTVAIQINRKVLELILQGIYPSANEPAFQHGPADPNAPRGTPPWRNIFVENGAPPPRWFVLADYGYVPGTPDAARFTRDTLNFELDVSAVDVVGGALSTDNRFKRILVQTRWQDKNQTNWKVISTEAFGLPEAD